MSSEAGAPCGKSNNMPYKMSRRDHRSSQGNSRTRNGSGLHGPSRQNYSRYGDRPRMTLEQRLTVAQRQVEYLQKQLGSKKSRMETPKPEPPSQSVVAKVAKPVGTSGGSMTRSSSMGGLPSNTSPLKPGSPRRPSTKRESFGGGPNGAKSATQTPATKSAASTPVSNATKPKQSKNRLGYRSDRTPLTKIVEESAIGAIDDAADKAVFREHTAEVKGIKVQSWAEKREARKRKAFVSTDLYWYLRVEFLFEARTKDILKRMKMKAKQFMSNHDMEGISLEYQFVLIVDTIRMVLEVHPKEEELRQGLRSSDGSEMREKHANLFDKGVVGNTWWGGSKKLPPPKVQ